MSARYSFREAISRADRDLIVADWWSKGSTIEIATRHTDRLKRLITQRMVKNEWAAAKDRLELPRNERPWGGFDLPAQFAAAVQATPHGPLHAEIMARITAPAAAWALCHGPLPLARKRKTEAA